ncbi:MAG: hypothetical protein J6Q57_04100, partial [Paraprevotella sp.]|nr:hypothetical protein [Paraprevotella sp.]
MKKWIGLVASIFIFGQLSASVILNNAEGTPWFFDEDVSYNDVATLRSGDISDNESSSVTLTFSDVSCVEFYIKVSSESGYDKLIVDFGDGVINEYSGEHEWEQCYYDWGWSGERVVTLTYSKDSSVSLGDDCCWIWFEDIDSLALGQNGSIKKWDTSEDYPWSVSPYDIYWNVDEIAVPSMVTPYLDNGQESWMSDFVEGIESFSFVYTVSSEENSDCLLLSVDGQVIESFSGERWSESYEIQFSDTNRHVITWTYRKDSNGNCSGNDKAYIWFEGIEEIVTDGYSMNMVYPWAKDEENTYYGSCSLRSGRVFDGESTSFSTTVPVGCETFGYYWKVSSEEGCDYLRVYKNDELVDSISGESEWSSSWFWVTPGDVIRFEYEKDDNGKSSGNDCGWVYSYELEKFMSIMHLFPDDEDATAEVSRTVVLNLNTGRDVQRGILDGDEGVSFASGEYPAWVHDENEGAMRSAEVVRGGESWMSAAVIGKGTFSFRWKSSGETLSCYVDGELKETLSGAADWARV